MSSSRLWGSPATTRRDCGASRWAVKVGSSACASRTADMGTRLSLATSEPPWGARVAGRRTRHRGTDRRAGNIGTRRSRRRRQLATAHIRARPRCNGPPRRDARVGTDETRLRRPPPTASPNPACVASWTPPGRTPARPGPRLRASRSVLEVGHAKAWDSSDPDPNPGGNSGGNRAFDGLARASANKKLPVSREFWEAAEGTRTLDLLNGKRKKMTRLAMKSGNSPYLQGLEMAEIGSKW